MPEPHPVTRSNPGCQDAPLKADPCHGKSSSTPPHKCWCDVHGRARIPESISDAYFAQKHSTGLLAGTPDAIDCAVYVAPYGSEAAWHNGAEHKRKGLCTFWKRRLHQAIDLALPKDLVSNLIALSDQKQVHRWLKQQECSAETKAMRPSARVLA